MTKHKKTKHKCDNDGGGERVSPLPKNRNEKNIEKKGRFS